MGALGGGSLGGPQLGSLGGSSIRVLRGVLGCGGGS